MSRSDYEDQLSYSVADYLDHQPWLFTHFPAGEYRPVKVGAKLKKMGLKRGVPDYLIFEQWCEIRGTEPYGFEVRGFGVAIELKSPKGVPTKYQREWLGALKARGWSTHICRTIHEVHDACEVLR